MWWCWEEDREREREPKGRKRKVRKAPTMLAKNKCPKNILYLKILTVLKVVDFLNLSLDIIRFFAKVVKKREGPRAASCLGL